MEEQKSTAGQGLGIAGLVLGILAIVLGIIPCTFYIGIILGIVGLVLSLVALSQANRAYGPKNLIIAALICSVLGLTFASVLGFNISRGGARFIKGIIHERFPQEQMDQMDRDAGDILQDLENDTATTPDHPASDLKHMTDTLKVLEGEKKTP